MKLTSWGRYPVCESTVNRPRSDAALAGLLHTQPPSSSIARGMGRSYGDSALAEHVYSTTALDQFIAFDEERGLLRCAAGVTLETLLHAMMPRGWFLPVVPGTWHVSIGGAIASDEGQVGLYRLALSQHAYGEVARDDGCAEIAKGLR